MNRKKIYWIAHEGHRSGANNAMIEYAARLNKEDYDVTVIVPHPGNLVEECRKRNLTLKLFYYTWTVYFSNRINWSVWFRRRSRNFVTLIQFSWFILRKRPNIIITNSIVTTPLFAIAARIFRIKHVWFIQEFGNKDHGFKFDFGYPLTAKIINTLSSKVIVVADAIKEHLAQFTSPSNMVTIFNRVSVPEEYKGTGPSSNRQPFKILHLAQVGPTKNQKEGIIAVKKLLEQGFNVQLEIVGENLNQPYYNELDQYIKDNNIEANVLLSGFTKEPYRKIKESNAVILCSRCEACALTIFETLQIGTPIVVSHTGGNTEIVKNGEIGLVYTFSDPIDLSEQLKKLYTDEDFARKLSRNAVSYSRKHYTTEESIKQIRGLLQLLH